MRDLYSKNSDKGGEGVKNPENLADVICEWPLREFKSKAYRMTNLNAVDGVWRHVEGPREREVIVELHSAVRIVIESEPLQLGRNSIDI